MAMVVYRSGGKFPDSGLTKKAQIRPDLDPPNPVFFAKTYHYLTSTAHLFPRLFCFFLAAPIESVSVQVVRIFITIWYVTCVVSGLHRVKITKRNELLSSSLKYTPISFKNAALCIQFAGKLGSTVEGGFSAHVPNPAFRQIYHRARHF
jgi:hypothetical protein